MSPLSVVIIACNEEKNIRDCLESVKWADEIVLIDSGSKDKTLDITKEYTDKIFFKEWEGFSKQRVFSLEKVSYDWVLCIDADERVSPELKDEILELRKSGFRYSGYFIPRRNYFLGKHITSCFWYPDYQLRLFDKKNTKVSERKVHEGFLVEGNKANLKNDLIHLTHQTLSETLTKINHYSTLEAEERFMNKKIGALDILFHPIAAFLNHFISRKGYKDGIYGMLVSIIHAMTNLMTYMKMWELQNKKKELQNGKEG